jgi:RPA family protein
MSSTVAPDLQDRIQTISDAFAAFDESRVAGGSDPTFALDQRDIEDQLERMCAYRVPMDEAVRTIVRKACTDADLDRDDLTDDLAKLAGYGGRPQKAARTMLNSIDEADKWVDVVAEVVELWQPRSEKIAQVGLLGDESGRLKFVVWASADLPELEEGGTYEFESVVTDEYQGRFSVSCNSATSISETDQFVEVSDGTIEVIGSIVDVQEGSGLIKRCGQDDCTRVLRNGRCAEHGQRDGDFDLRIKAILDDGERSVSVLFNEEATEAVTGISLDDATTMAMDALSTNVVADEISEQLLGRRFRLTGSVFGTYFLVDEAEETDAVSAGLDSDAVEPALTQRQPATRLFAEELNATTHTFQESDEERAPVYGLTPTGIGINRVFVVGTLTETADVGNDSEYWQGKVFAASSPVYVYAGQYQPEAMAALRAAETPTYVAIVGKIRTYESGDRVNVAIEPESITEVDESTREAWVAEAAAQTHVRLDVFEEELAPFGGRSREVYGDDVRTLFEDLGSLDGEIAE